MPGYYDRHLLPYLLHFSCSRAANMAERRAIVPMARGVVLELGAGSGLNLSFYNRDNIEKLFLLEPSAPMLALARKNNIFHLLNAEIIQESAEAIPLENRSVDTVLVTYSLCTIPDVAKALAEARRVLKPDGQLLFCEHGLSPDASVEAWQNRLDRMWGKVSGGCHLNRPINRLVESSGFQIGEMDTKYIKGWRTLTYTYVGHARIR